MKTLQRGQDCQAGLRTRIHPTALGTGRVIGVGRDWSLKSGENKPREGGLLDCRKDRLQIKWGGGVCRWAMRVHSENLTSFR